MKEARALLASREQLLADLRRHLISFEGRYLRQVGSLYRRLDEWERKIAELHGAPKAQDAEQPFENVDYAATEADPAALKAMFRDLVKLVHPDFSVDATDEVRRTLLMAQANDAYSREDADALRRMINGYDPVLTLKTADDVRSEVTRMLAMIFQITQDTEAVNLQIKELQHSESSMLQQRTLEAARTGRDLLAEMAARVNGSIGLAMRRYDLDLSRIKQPSSGPSVETLVTAETTR